MHEVILPVTCMFKDELDMIIAESGYTKQMWLKQIRCPINDWLRANTTAPYEIWKWAPAEPPTFPVGYLPTDEELYPGWSIVFKFEDGGDAMRFKLTWG